MITTKRFSPAKAKAGIQKNTGRVKPGMTIHMRLIMYSRFDIG